VQLSQARLLVDDFAAAFRFYRDELELPVGFGDEASGYASFGTSGGTVALFERKEQAETVELRPAGDAVLVVLEVEDVDAQAVRLGSHMLGAPVDRSDWGGRVAYLRDPAGNLVELFQPIPFEAE
jgi:catechol 2,3-dioxygenase-like lactoylglutathione lyase family enzyme